MPTMSQAVAALNIKATITRTDRNPNAADDEWARTADHWHVTIRREGRRMQTVFSMGSGHHGKAPKLCEVLDSLASDAAGFESARGFEDWCAEYGYETDSRKAERIYRAVERQTASLKRVLGSTAAFDAIIYADRL